MNCLDATSSDLDAARGISARLAAPMPAPVRPDAPTYVRFAARTGGEPSSGELAWFPSPPEVCSRDSFGDERWLDFLTWLAKACSADAAFVMDAHGLPIASVGTLCSDEIDLMGSRLMIAFEQAARMREKVEHVGAIIIEFDDQRLTDISVWIDESLVFTIGIFGPSSPGRALRDAVAGAVARSYATKA